MFNEPKYPNQSFLPNGSYGGGFIRNTSRDQLSDYQNHTVYENPFENNASRYEGQNNYNVPFQNKNKRDFKGQKVVKKPAPPDSAISELLLSYYVGFLKSNIDGFP